ncbi:sensor histidine kinase [Galbitalea soli]|uniref:Sensor-like histidine kinase SenX3 n=1 Tax=Galbitalea soli TaxID=1268042 RepID=A0A7C9PPG1_9MICO|nr:ATP-binding protein [Galbitalea soli]NEM92332.1 two-component sensor histidine kinase [Galbitalea soli]NYJ31711.1 two-component system sensor histidine kinase SenX3 [Galbitalea soli]
MDSATLVPLALAFGALVGAAVTTVIVLAHRRGQRAAAVATPSVPDGVDQVLDALESAGVVLDPSNVVVKASPGAVAFGLVLGRALVHAELLDMVDRVRRDGEAIEQEVDLARGPFGDAHMYLFVRVARLGARYVLLVAEDRTESYRLDSVRRDFVANISHELKTPIGAVGLLAEALSSASDDPEQVRKFAKRLTKEAERLARITQEIIELSRLQAADALSKPDLVDIDDVVSLAIDQNHVVAEAENIQLVRGGDKHVRVFGDEALLVVALHNLIANAIQYSPQNSRVGIGVNCTDGVVEIAVTDQGIGIPEEERERVFERFFRVDPARSRHTGGSGLGLSIVKHVVQNHGGDVRVWSQPGRGSTFTIRLPEATGASALTLGAEL